MGAQNCNVLLQLVFLCWRRWGRNRAFPAACKYAHNPCNVFKQDRPCTCISAFLEGVDAVLITGCHLGDCHYINGNEKTLVKFNFMRSMLKELGLEEERLQLNWISASEGEKFAEVVRMVTEQVRQLGPSVLKPEGVA